MQGDDPTEEEFEDPNGSGDGARIIAIEIDLDNGISNGIHLAMAQFLFGLQYQGRGIEVLDDMAQGLLVTMADLICARAEATELESGGIPDAERARIADEICGALPDLIDQAVARRENIRVMQRMDAQATNGGGCA